MNIFRLLNLGLRRFRSEEDYRAMQSFLAEETVKELKARGIDIAQRDVIEIGAGNGGYSQVLNRIAKSFIACDLNKKDIYEKEGIPFAEVDVTTSLPFSSGQFDFIYCSSLIEHLAEPNVLLQECKRILRPDGTLYLSFPPFYSLMMIGGHVFKPFHFLGERLSVWMTNRVKRHHIKNYATCFGNFGLYPLKVNQVKEWLITNDFKITDIYTRLSFINTARLPGTLKDLFTWHVCYLAKKK